MLIAINASAGAIRLRFIVFSMLALYKRFIDCFGHILRFETTKRNKLITIETKMLRDIFSKNIFSNHFFNHKYGKLFLLEILK